jgi:hypothetical protein
MYDTFVNKQSFLAIKPFLREDTDTLAVAQAKALFLPVSESDQYRVDYHKSSQIFTVPLTR